MKVEQKSIQLTLMDFFSDCDTFTTREAVEKIVKEKKVNPESVRARIYEGIDKGLFERCTNLDGKIVRGVYKVVKDNTTTILVNGNGRDLSFISDNSVDCIITDHPYDDEKAHKGGNRDFTEYNTFYYNQSDFEEKFRVLKEGAFLVEMLPEESNSNYEYLYQIKTMAKEAGFQYYAKVPWKKGSVVRNTGRKAKNVEDIIFFSKGKPRCLKPDQKKNKKTMIENGYSEFLKGKDSLAVEQFLISKGLPVEYMSGTYGILPTCFDYEIPSKEKKIHQAEKPVELFLSIINYVMRKGELLLDQFSGSGAVGEAGILSGMNTLLIELEENNCDKIHNRLSSLNTIVLN